MIYRSRAGVALMLVGGLLCPRAEAGDDLATAARKEKERRAKIAKPVKVLTEDDGKEATQRGSGSLTEMTGEGVLPPSPVASTDNPAQAQSVPTQKAWKTRAVNARAAVAAAEATLAQMLRDLAAYRADMAPVPAEEAQDPMRLQKREARIIEMIKEVDSQRAAVAAARKSLADFEDEARRSHVPPGWLR